MNLNELSAVSAKAVQANQQNMLFNNNWEASSELAKTLAVSKDVSGSDDSFLSRSEVLRSMLKSINVTHLSIPDLILLSQAAKAIEDGDSKAAQFVRDTTGGKPVEKHQNINNNIVNLSDAQIAYLLNNAEIVQK